MPSPIIERDRERDEIVGTMGKRAAHLSDPAPMGITPRAARPSRPRRRSR